MLEQIDQNTFKGRISEIKKISEDVLHIEIKENEKFTKADFLELKEAARQLGNGQRFYNLVNVGAHTNPNLESMDESMSKAGSKYKLADAFILNSAFQRTFGNTMLLLQHPAVPTKFFTKLEEAEKWIKKLQEEKRKKDQPL